MRTNKQIITPPRGRWRGVSLLAFLPSFLQAQQRPNILYIMTDDHTMQMMSCYDKTHVHTPNLDRIAQDGVRFVNSFAKNFIRAGRFFYCIYIKILYMAQTNKI